jgi:hypothetical protein
MMFLRGTRSGLLGTFLLATLVVGGTIVVADPVFGTPRTWTPTEISLPGVPYESIGYIHALSCISTSSCVAVGNDGNGAPFTVSGDPTNWIASDANEDPITSSSLGGSSNGVSCLSAVSCVAVGGDSNGQPFVLLGDPTSWTSSDATELTLGASFGSGGSLSAITCATMNFCVAVGSDRNDEPLALFGDPTSWTSSDATELTLGASFGSGGLLNSVNCPSPTFCVAVGEDSNSQPLVIDGDPSTWDSTNASEITLGASFGSGGLLNSVNCPSSTFCVSVGEDSNSQPLVIDGDPSTWDLTNAYEATLDATYGTLGSTLNGLYCTSTTYCVADGGDGNEQPLVFEGDPASLSETDASEISLGATPFGSGGNLSSVYCASPTICVLAGNDSNPGGSEPLSIVDFTAPVPPTPTVTYVPITFSDGGGTGTPPSSLSEPSGSSFVLPSGSALNKTGWSFAGWSDGVSVFQPGATYQAGNVALIFTAVWIPLSKPISKPVASPAARARDVVYFAFNSFVLSPAAMTSLRNFAATIKSDGARVVEITASTDRRGSQTYNRQLSVKRARAAGAYLERQLAQLGVTNVSTHLVGAGISTSQPTFALNRRAVLDL